MQSALQWQSKTVAIAKGRNCQNSLGVFADANVISCLQFVVRTRPDKRFIRTGNDLLYNATITLVDALLGFSVKVRTMRAMTTTQLISCSCYVQQSSFAYVAKLKHLEVTVSNSLLYFADPASGRP